MKSIKRFSHKQDVFDLIEIPSNTGEKNKVSKYVWFDTNIWLYHSELGKVKGSCASVSIWEYIMYLERHSVKRNLNTKQYSLANPSHRLHVFTSNKFKRMIFTSLVVSFESLLDVGYKKIKVSWISYEKSKKIKWKNLLKTKIFLYAEYCFCFGMLVYLIVNQSVHHFGPHRNNPTTIS